MRTQIQNIAEPKGWPNQQIVSFRVVDSNREISEIGALRHDVWTGEGVYVPDFDGSEKGVWLDELDAGSMHFVAEYAGSIIAAARLSIHEDPSTVPDYEWLAPMHHAMNVPCVSLNRLVVDHRFRGHGIARKLDCLRIEEAVRINAKTAVVVGVGQSRVKAIEGLGFHFSHFLPKGNGLMTPEYPLGALYLAL